MKGIFITGTDTNIGKTWVGVRLIQALKKQGFDITPRKPVESGWNPDIYKTDTWQLANAANKIGQLDEICPNRFSQVASPARAAMAEAHQLSTKIVAQQCHCPQKENSIVFVEGAGGFYSPLTQDGLNSDLAAMLGLPVLLVAENRLGCINQVLLSTSAIKAASLRTAVVVLNDITEKTREEKLLGRDNLEDLRSLLDCPVVSLAHNETAQANFADIAKLIAAETRTVLRSPTT